MSDYDDRQLSGCGGFVFALLITALSVAVLILVLTL